MSICSKHNTSNPQSASGVETPSCDPLCENIFKITSATATDEEKYLRYRKMNSVEDTKASSGKKDKKNRDSSKSGSPAICKLPCYKNSKKCNKAIPTQLLQADYSPSNSDVDECAEYDKTICFIHRQNTYINDLKLQFYRISSQPQKTDCELKAMCELRSCIEKEIGTLRLLMYKVIKLQNMCGGQYDNIEFTTTLEEDFLTASNRVGFCALRPRE